MKSNNAGRSGLQFSYGRVQLGHLHGPSFTDPLLPKKVRDELMAQVQALVHSPLPASGWAARQFEAARSQARS